MINNNNTLLLVSMIIDISKTADHELLSILDRTIKILHGNLVKHPITLSISQQGAIYTKSLVRVSLLRFVEDRLFTISSHKLVIYIPPIWQVFWLH